MKLSYGSLKKKTNIVLKSINSSLHIKSKKKKKQFLCKTSHINYLVEIEIELSLTLSKPRSLQTSPISRLTCVSHLKFRSQG